MQIYKPHQDAVKLRFNSRLSLQLDRAIIAYEAAPIGSIAREVARMEKRMLEGGVPAFRRKAVQP
jgi:hypothetical protein